MRNLIVGLLSFSFFAIFALTSEAFATAKDDVKANRKPAHTLTDKEVDEVFSKLDDKCAGNDNGGTLKFNVKTFNAKKAKKDLRKRNNGCRGMKMARSKEEAINAFTQYIKKSGDDFSSCVNENLTKQERELVINVANDPQNIGVFSSQFDGGDESEACSFYHFDIYRASGQKIQVVHDETD